MVTRLSDVVDVDPSSGLVRLCAWCIPAPRLVELHQEYRCTDGICPDCQARLLATPAPASLCQLQVVYPSGAEHTLTFASAFTRGLYVIALAAQPVTLRLLALLLAVLAVAAPAHAEPKFSGAGLTPYVLVVAGQGADLASTARNYALGFTESNPVYGSHATLGKIALVKAGETAAIVGLMKLFEKTGHPGAAKVLGYMGGIGGVIPAAINLRARGR